VTYGVLPPGAKREHQFIRYLTGCASACVGSSKRRGQFPQPVFILFKI